eukprot:m.118648 g.118648  ORF g.118648 m.118648 type:complete len:267 (+) comp17217_c0_seq2:159-959(+)
MSAPPSEVPPPPAEMSFYSADEKGADAGGPTTETSAHLGLEDVVLNIPSDLGDMETPMASKAPTMDSSNKSQATPGLVSGFAAKQGFGWLMELDDEDDDMSTPLLEELDIDIKDIWHKVRCILLPIDYGGFKRSIVRESPDFWGPLLVVFLYAMASMYGNWKATSWILTIWFLGSFSLFFLLRVMGGDASFSQTLGVIGYALMPLALIAVLVLPLVRDNAGPDFAVKLLGVRAGPGCVLRLTLGCILVASVGNPSQECVCHAALGG